MDRDEQLSSGNGVYVEREPTELLLENGFITRKPIYPKFSQNMLQYGKISLVGEEMFALPYTICFCLCGNQVLMLYRNNPPNANRWNGLGGKIEAGETPWDNIHREMLEEADIDLHQALELRFSGLVTWVVLDVPSTRGMYVFIARMAPNFPLTPDRPTPEGLLSWKAWDWVCDQANLAAVDNIALFLPPMLTEQEPQEYRCSYQGGKLLVVTANPLPVDVPGF